MSYIVPESCSKVVENKEIKLIDLEPYEIKFKISDSYMDEIGPKAFTESLEYFKVFMESRGYYWDGYHRDKGHRIVIFKKKEDS